MEREPLVPVEPGANLGMLVSRVVIENDMNGLAGWHLCLDGVQEADELLMAMALHVATDDGAVEHIERSEQCRRAMTLVRGLSFRRAPSSWEGPAGFDRTPGFGSSRQPTGRWREPAGRHIETDHIAQLVDELGIGRELELLDLVRPKTMRAPDALHRANTDPRCLGHHSARPVRGLARRVGLCQGHDALSHIRA